MPSDADALAALAEAAARRALELQAANAKRDDEFAKLTPEEQAALRGSGKTPDPQKFPELAAASTARTAVHRRHVEASGSFETWKSDSGARGVQLGGELSAAAMRALTIHVAKVVAYVVGGGGAIWLGIDRLIHWLDPLK